MRAFRVVAVHWMRAKQGNPSPLGGTFGTMDAWPSFGESGCATVNSATPGSGVLSAHMLFR